MLTILSHIKTVTKAETSRTNLRVKSRWVASMTAARPCVSQCPRRRRPKNHYNDSLQQYIQLHSPSQHGSI